ncbi:MAG: hypothetical protein ACT4TC_17950, partial [Myxococcaceae bacterium]
MTVVPSNPGGDTSPGSGSLLARLVLEPSAAVLAPNGTVQFRIAAVDSAGSQVVPVPVISWRASGGGSISNDGLFTAGGNAGGPYTLTASSGPLSTQASVTVQAATPPSAPPPGPGTYRGTCDGSGAVELGGDYFLTVNDEEQTARVYRRANSAAGPVAQVDLSAGIGMSTTDEADFEDMARVGNRVYVISSHGRNSSGSLRLTRHRFAAIDVGGTGPNVSMRVVGYSSSLLKDMLDAANWVTPNAAIISQLQAATKLGTETDADLAPEANGLSIEGLSAFPSPTAPTRLLIGLRNPQTGQRAIAISLLNPDGVVAGAKAKFGEAFALNL